MGGRVTRFKILALLLVVTAYATGRQFGPDPAYNALLTLIPVLVLGYFVARPENYSPDTRFHLPGRMDRVRKWARIITMAGFGVMAAGALIVGVYLYVPFDRGVVPMGLLGAINDYGLLLGLVLSGLGFAVWTFSAARSNAPKPGYIITRYGILVFLMVAAATCVGYLFSLSNDSTSAVALLFLVAAVVLFSFVAQPERYNSASGYFQPGGVALARRGAIRAMLWGVALFLLGVVAFVVLKSVSVDNVTLVDGIGMAGALLIFSGGVVLCGGIFALCAALFLKRV